MVERLKAAIEKARAQREGATPAPESAPAPAPDAAAEGPAPARSAPGWSRAPAITPDAARLDAERIVSFGRSDPSFVAFDLLRTRLLKACREHSWRRVGVTSAAKASGKSTVCLNLAFSLARNPGLRVLVVDLDMKAPQLSDLLGEQATPRRMGDFFSGAAPFESVFVGVGDNLVIGLNTARERDSAELLHSAEAAGALARLLDALAPDIVLYDLPPMLVADDTIAFAPNMDAVMLVAAAEETTAAEITECERLLKGSSNLLGIVLNKCRLDAPDRYAYDYAQD